MSALPIPQIQSKIQEWFPDWYLEYYRDSDPTTIQFKAVNKDVPAVMRAEKYIKILDLGTYPSGKTIVYLQVALPLQFCREYGIKF